MINIKAAPPPQSTVVKGLSLEESPLWLPFVNLDELHDLPSIRACYFILHDDQILYIGRTKDLRKRWISHHILRNYKIPSSAKIAWYEAQPNWSLEKMERSLIEYYNPKINVPCKNQNTVRLTINVPEVTHRSFKEACVREGITMADKMNSFIEDWLKTNP